MRFAVIDSTGYKNVKRNIKKIRRFFKRLYKSKDVQVVFSMEKLIYQVVVKNEKV